jgi:hypothetical protein
LTDKYLFSSGLKNFDTGLWFGILV